MKLLKYSLMVSVIGFATQTAAADFDGSKDLICASLRAVDCTRVGECNEGLAEDFEIPQFFSIDFKAKAIQAKRPDETEINTSFESRVGDQGKLILIGTEGGRGWTAAISQETGRLVLAVAGDDVSFALFAACTPKP